MQCYAMVCNAMTIFRVPNQGLAKSFSGTRVVLPAPGSATRMAAEPSAKASLNCGMTPSTGNSTGP